jgi:arylsulfatase
MGAAPAGQGNKPRLYNLDAEIGEKTDVAAQHPEIVARLQALAAKVAEEIGGAKPAARRPPGMVEHATLLYAPAAEALPDAKPRRLDALKPGATLRSAAAPNVAARGFELSCVVETAQKDAVIVAHGGIAAGYALHLKGGRVGFAVRTGAGDAIGEIFASPAASDKLRIRATLAADATMSLQVNDQPPVTGKAHGLIPKQPAEEFCVGHDSLKPVTSYGGTEPFHGSVQELKIEFPK